MEERQVSFIEDIKAVQRAVGAEPDGIFGPVTAAATLAELRKLTTGDMGGDLSDEVLDFRSEENLKTLDAKAQDVFRDFLLRAKATAATFGCEYVMISGHRSWEEQDVLYARGRTVPGDKITNAKGGQSNHNFGIAADFAVFQGKIYLDGGTNQQAALARRVHAACAVHARKLGMDWGGDWRNLKDEPHFEIHTGLTLAQKRSVYQQRGSVL